jgi:hypothetical protein
MKTIALAAALVLALAADAAAQLPPELGGSESAETCAAPLEPAWVPVRDSGLDAARSACTETALHARARGLAVIDEGDFYGTVAGSLFVSGRWLTRGGIELSATVRAIDYRFAQNAVLTADEVSLGPIVLGVSQSRPTTQLGSRGSWAPELRLEIPRSTWGDEATAIAASPAATLSLAWSQNLQLHLRGRLLLWAARAAAGIDTRAALAASTDVGWRPGRWTAITAGLEAQAGWHESFDHLLTRAAVRVGADFAVELAAAAPIPALGDERTDLIVTLSAGQRL